MQKISNQKTQKINLKGHFKEGYKISFDLLKISTLLNNCFGMHCEKGYNFFNFKDKLEIVFNSCS